MRINTFLSVGTFLICLFCIQFSTAQMMEQRQEGRSYALIITNNTFESASRSDGASPLSFARPMIVLLEQMGYDIEFMQDPQRSDVLNIIEFYQNKFYSPNDQLFVYIIGNSKYDEDLAEGFLITHPASTDNDMESRKLAIPYLADLIDKIPCGHMLLFMDLCHSRPFHTPLSQTDFTFTPEDRLEFQQFLSRTQAKRSRLAVSATNKNASMGTMNNWALSSALQNLLSTRFTLGLPTTFSIIYDRLAGIYPKPVLGSFGKHQLGGDFYFNSANIRVSVPSANYPNVNIPSYPREQTRRMGNSRGNTSTFIYHTVKKGENLYRIGKRYHIPYVDIQKWNNMMSTDIYPGDKLIVGVKTNF